MSVSDVEYGNAWKGRAAESALRGRDGGFNVAHERQFTCCLDASVASSAPLRHRRERGTSTPASRIIQARISCWFAPLKHLLTNGLSSQLHCPFYCPHLF